MKLVMGFCITEYRFQDWKAALALDWACMLRLHGFLHNLALPFYQRSDTLSHFSTTVQVNRSLVQPKLRERSRFSILVPNACLVCEGLDSLRHSFKAMIQSNTAIRGKS